MKRFAYRKRRSSQAARYERSYVKPLVRKLKVIPNSAVSNPYLGTSTCIFEMSWIRLIE